VHDIRKNPGALSQQAAMLKNAKGAPTSQMSSKKNNAPMPASSAGLLTFFNEETEGVKIRPEIVLIGSIVLIAVSIAINILFR
jgi:preprotein translocase subunit Sec61beta